MTLTTGQKIQMVIMLTLISVIAIAVFKQTSGNKRLHKEPIAGLVTWSTKKFKGYYSLQILDHTKVRQISYLPGSDSLMAYAGDSVFKERNSDIFFIKKRQTLIVRADWKRVYISGRWDK